MTPNIEKTTRRKTKSSRQVTKQDEQLVRECLRAILAGGSPTKAALARFNAAVAAKAHRGRDREELRQGFTVRLMEHRRRVEDLLRAPSGELDRWLGQAIKRYLHEVDGHTITGSLAKALGEVIRARTDLFSGTSRVTLVQRRQHEWPATIEGMGGVFDHEALAQAATAALSESLVGLSRPELAAAVARKYPLYRVAQVPKRWDPANPGTSPTTAVRRKIDASRHARRWRRSLSPRELLVLRRTAEDRTLEQIGEELRIKKSTVHDLLARAKRKLQELAASQGVGSCTGDAALLPLLNDETTSHAATGSPNAGDVPAAGGTVLHATDADFDKIAAAASSAVLVDLWAPWCDPCHAMEPVLDRLAKRLAGTLTVIKVNVDESPGLADRFGVSAIPTLILLRGRKRQTRVGFASEKELELWIAGGSVLRAAGTR